MDINIFRVSPIGDAIELWVEVPDGPRFKNITIEKIAIQDHNHYTVSYPEKPQVELTINNPIDDLNITNVKSVSKRLKFKDLGLFGIECSGIYFMYIKSTGMPDECFPINCGCHKDLEIAVALNLYPLFNLSVKLINEFDNVCKENTDKLIDIYLKEQMLKDAIMLGDYTQAIDIWNRLLYNDLKKANCLNICNPCNTTSSNNSNNTSTGCKTCG